MPTPSPVGHGTASCGCPRRICLCCLPAPEVHRGPSAGSLARHDRASTAAEGFAFGFALCVCVCVCMQW